MGDSYRKPSLTPEAKRHALERARYAKAWQQHARQSRSGLRTGLARIAVGALFVYAFVTGKLVFGAVGGGVMVVAHILSLEISLACPSCGEMWLRKSVPLAPRANV